MNKRAISFLLAAALVSASAPAVYGAEFTTGEEALFEASEEALPAEENLFTDGEPKAAERVLMEEEAAEEARLTPQWTVVDVKLVKGPKKVNYWYGLERTNEWGVLDSYKGTKIEITYQDGHKTTAEFDSLRYYEDEAGNVFQWYPDFSDEYSGMDNLPVCDGEIVLDVPDGLEQIRVPIHILSPKKLPELNSKADGKAVTKQQTIDRQAIFKLIAKADGHALFTSKNSALVDARDDKMNWISYMDGKNGYIDVKKGKTYYLTFYLDGGKDGECSVTTEYAPAIASVEVVRKPMENRLWEHIDADLKGIRFRITYKNGVKETIDPFNLDGIPSTTRYGDWAQRYYDGNPKKTAPTAGTKSITYDVGGHKFTYKVKHADYTELPMLKGPGKKKGYNNSWGAAYIQFRTGSASKYIISSTKKTTIVVCSTKPYESYDEGPNGVAIAGLKPNTTYVVYAASDEGRKLQDVTFTIKEAPKTSISKCTVKIEPSSADYTGKALKPAVSVTDRYMDLHEGVDYTLAYSANTEIGTAKVTIKGKGSYTGTVTKTFKIVLKKPVLKSAKSSTARTAVVAWEKVPGATSYAVYAKYGNGWKEIGTTTKTSFTHNGSNKVWKAESGKTYTYTVRAYREKAGKTYSSAYNSKGISVKVK